MAWKGTAVPNSGTVDKIYLNTNLSVEEVVSILENINNEYGQGGTITLVTYGSKDLTIVKPVDGDKSTWYIGDFSTTEIYFSQNLDMSYADFVGWNPNFNGVIEVNSEVGGGHDLSNYTSLFSVTPFEQVQPTLKEWAVDIADAIREKKELNSPIPHLDFAKEIRNLKGSQAETTRLLKADYEQKEYSTLVSTTVPNSGQLGRIYFNKELPNEEILELISLNNLNYYTSSRFSYYYVVSEKDGNINIFIQIYNGKYQIYINTPDLSTWLWNGEKWNETLESNFFDLNIKLSNKNSNNKDVGLQNDLLKKLFSITPFGVDLEGFCGNVANAIRTRKATTDPINAQNFEEEILNIESNAKTTNEIFQPTKADIGSSGNVYVNVNAYTPSELTQFIDDLVDNKGMVLANYIIFENEDFKIEFVTKNALQSKRQIRIFDKYQNRITQTLFSGSGWNSNIDFTLPIISNMKPITIVGEYNYLIENLFSIGENRYRIKVNLDIEPENLQRIETVEIVTKTENKVIYAENGTKIFEVDELPTPSFQEIGKTYKYQDKLFTGIEKPKAYEIGNNLGNSIRFDTRVNLAALCEVTGFQQLDIISTSNYSLQIVDVLALLELAGMGKCIGVALTNKSTQTIESLLYAYCDTLTVAQFNINIGSRFGISISEFGWIKDSLDTKSISGEVVETICDKATINAIATMYSFPLIQFVYSSNSTYHFSSDLDCVCYRENEIIEIPKTISKIDKYAFYYNDNLKKIIIPSSVTSIGNNAFTFCNSLTEIVIPDSVTSIGNAAFSETGLANVTLSSGLTEIPNECFDNCVYLKNIKIPSGVQTIGIAAFRDCSYLKSIIIPSSVTNIMNNAFENCDELTNIYFTGSQSQWNSITIASEGNSMVSSATVHFDYVEE